MFLLSVFNLKKNKVVVRTRNKNLFFSTDVDGVVEDSDIIFISVNTPTKLAGIGAGRAANIKNCELAARNIAKVATKGKIVVEKSTVPVRTAQAVATVLANNDKGLKFQVFKQKVEMNKNAIYGCNINIYIQKYTTIIQSTSISIAHKIIIL